MNEPITSQVAHWLTTGGVFLILGVIAKEHKIMVRAKDRLNDLWREYCEEKDIPYSPLDNGK